MHCDCSRASLYKACSGAAEYNQNKTDGKTHVQARPSQDWNNTSAGLVVTAQVIAQGKAAKELKMQEEKRKVTNQLEAASKLSADRLRLLKLREEALGEWIDILRDEDHYEGVSAEEVYYWKLEKM
jgi:hypothetical protein